MNEQNTIDNQQDKSEQSKKGGFFNGVLIVIILAGLFYLAIQNPGVAWKIFLVVLGFGAVVMIHELGHFLMAKFCGIRVEVFSIGFPPFLMSIRKLKKGMRFRFMPQFGPEEIVQEGDSETEYTIGIIPFGGFVKMLGQSDSGAVEKTEDPRSYLNKPIWQRIVVVAGGVVFNAIGAMILFMALFLHGMKLTPPIVGKVIPNSPADVAGIKAGDRIVEIKGEKFIDFTTIMLSAALSDKEKGVPMKIQKADGSISEIALVAEKPFNDTAGLRAFGIAMPSTLTASRDIRDSEDIEFLYKETGFRPGDIITAVDGKPVTQAWLLDGLVSKSLSSSVKLTVSREYPKGSPKTTEQMEIPLYCAPSYPNFRNEFDLTNIYSMVPRLKVQDVGLTSEKKNFLSRIKSFFGGQKAQTPVSDLERLKKGDIIVKIAEVQNPTYKDLREKTTEYKNKPLELVVLRADGEGKLLPVTIKLTPKVLPGDEKRVVLGFNVGLDMEHAVVARTIDLATGPGALGIAPGAEITAVDGQPVQSFYDVIRIIRQNSGQKISIEFKTGADAGGTALEVPQQEVIHMQSEMLLAAPMEVYKEVYRASNPWQATVWGVKRTWQFIMQSIDTLMGLFRRQVGVNSLSGPVGIVSISYKMASQGVVDLLYFFGLLSSCLAVMNLLPLPIVDGGVILLLIIEKFRGVPLSHKMQEIITYAGLALLLTLFVLVTYNDILRWIILPK